MFNESIKIQVEITQEIFAADDSNYKILRGKVLEQFEHFFPDDFVTITGHFPDISLNQPYEFTGKLIKHQKYGEQFQAEMIQKLMPKEENNILNYLQKLDVAGVGKKTIQRLYDHYGDEILERIAEDGREYLADFYATGWSEDKAKLLVRAIREEHADQMHFFKMIKYGFPANVVSSLYDAYEEDLETIIQTNAYQILEDFDGISIKVIDQVVSNHFPEQIRFRLYYAIIYHMKNSCYRTGSTVVTKQAIVDLVLQDYEFGHSRDEVDVELENLMNNKKVFAISKDVYQVDYFYYTEKNIAMRLMDLNELGNDYVNQSKQINWYLKECETRFSIEYASEQKTAIMQTFEAPVHLLTGGPGTGKTTIIQAILEVFILLQKAQNIDDEKIHEKIALLAPTGRASQRMLDSTGFPAQTIHRFLGWDMQRNTYRFNEEQPHSKIEFVIVDEASMLDIWLLLALLKALPNLKQLILVGDANQLPSVAPGQCFADLLQSNAFPVTILEYIFRQKKDSSIIDVAAQINRGEPSSVLFENSQDYSFLPIAPHQLLMGLEKICRNALTKGYTVEEIQILAPLYKTIVGINEINGHLQKVFNPDTYDDDERFAGIGEVIFLPNDKVIQLKNLPEFDVYNGDIGIIQSISKASSKEYEILINFSGVDVIYSADEMRHIAHAYCISIHKSQGSEFPLVIMPIFFQYSIMLYRQLIYTGVSRAKKALVVLGQQQALLQAVASTHEHVRQTALKGFLMKNTEKSKDEEVMITSIEDALRFGLTGEDLGGQTPYDFL